LKVVRLKSIFRREDMREKKIRDPFLLEVSSKTVELVIKMVNYLEVYVFFHLSQHGGTRNRSVCMALVKCARKS